MSNDPEDFDQLRKLLSLKRHEQPPPGFFRDLPGRVLSEIEREQVAPAGWWARLKESFELRPALSMGYAGALCALLVAGIHYGQRSGTEGGEGFVVNEVPQLHEAGDVNNPFNVSTGELAQPPAGIFDPALGPNVERVGFKTNTPARRP